MEQAAGRGADGLAVVRVDAVAREDHGGRAGGVGGAQDGAGVAGVADVGADGDQPGRLAQRVGEGDVPSGADRHQALRLDGACARRVFAGRFHSSSAPRCVGGTAVCRCALATMERLPNCHNIDCNDRRYQKFWERMAEAGLPLLAHTGGEHTVPSAAPGALPDRSPAPAS